MRAEFADPPVEAPLTEDQESIDKMLAILMEAARDSGAFRMDFSEEELNAGIAASIELVRAMTEDSTNEFIEDFATTTYETALETVNSAIQGGKEEAAAKALEILVTSPPPFGSLFLELVQFVITAWPEYIEGGGFRLPTGGGRRQLIWVLRGWLARGNRRVKYKLPENPPENLSEKQLGWLLDAIDPVVVLGDIMHDVPLEQHKEVRNSLMRDWNTVNENPDLYGRWTTTEEGRSILNFIRRSYAGTPEAEVRPTQSDGDDDVNPAV
jgi:hypothetical protein